MGKPSIFSKEYEKHMKRRKIKIAIIVCLLLAGILFAARSGFKDIISSNIKNNTNEEKNKKITSEAQSTNIEDAEKLPENKVEEKFYDVTLGKDIKVKAVYESKEGTNKFKYISTDNANISFNLNPSGTGIVIFDSVSQSIWFINIEGKAQDISDLSYKSYKRDTTLKKRPDYLWCTLPKFIDDENVAYFSQLPYIGKSSRKYLWTVNVNDKSKRRLKSSIKGENLKFKDVGSKGLEVIMDDGTSRFIKVNKGDIEVSK